MPNNSWKHWERTFCRLLGGARTGPIGEALPDCRDTPYIAVECKYIQKLSFREKDIAQAVRNAGDNFWVLALKERNTGRKFVVMDAEQFAALYRKLRELEDHGGF